MSGKGALADTCFITKSTPNFPRASNPPCRERAVASRHAWGNAVEIGPADLTEREKQVGNGATRQRLFRELARLDARLQRDLNDGSEHRLRSAHPIRRGKHPHSVQKPDQVLLIATR